jgi:hypothetical protein
MTAPVLHQAEALAPLRRALLDAARAAAATRRAEAEDEARAVEGEAAGRAAAMRAEARRRGAVDGADQLAAQRSAARRRARGVLLHAQRTAGERAREAAVVAVAEVLADPPQRERLAALAHDALGADTRVRDAPGGGLLAQARDGRRVDVSAAHLVDLVLPSVDVERLWAP